MYYYYTNAHDHHQYHNHHHYWSPSPDPYATTASAYSSTQPSAPLLPSPLERVAHLASGSAVVVFSSSGCCMCHAVKRLLRGMGVSPVVHELDMDPRGAEMVEALAALLGGNAIGSSPLPVVFVGGRLLGSMDRVMGCHISGELVPLLKEAGALWL